MPHIDAGDRLGPYEIVGAIGAGGMGAVYRARDTKLNRDVALKILPEGFAADPERLARFEREARTLAALNHPHIAHIYGFEQSAGTSALVMELVEGEDLAQRIARGPVPIEEAVPIARQMAEALEAAHEQGIIHRDLKPANIRLRSGRAGVGTAASFAAASHSDEVVVKLLDFGLAKALDAPAVSGANPANSPTLTAPMTQLGLILGTAAYMAPEQARGRAVDKRADIWAFGCVLYEMLTGRQAFAGETVSDSIAKILQSEPDTTLLPETTPPRIRELLRRCLQKDPRQRLRDIGEARVLLADAGSGSFEAAAVHAGSMSPGWRARLGWAAVGLLVAGILGVSIGYAVWPRVEPPRVQKFHVALQQDGSPIRAPVISPDGRNLVYVARSRLWVQSLDAWEPRELAGTDGAGRPFWSPAGDWIGYFRSEQLLRVPVAGGPVVMVSTLPAVQAPVGAQSAVWKEDGSIVISLADGPVYRVSSGGGELAAILQVPDDLGQDLHDLSLLPGGELLAVVHRDTGLDAIGLVSNGALRIILEVSSVRHPKFAPPGHLIFERRSPNVGLWAVSFSPGRLAITGEPFLITRGTEPSVARDGTLAYLGQPEDLERQLAWFTLDGRLGDIIAAPQDWTEGVAISTDGRRMAAAASDGLWVYDVASGARSRVTSGRSDITPRWVGTTGDLVFVRGEGEPVVMIKRADAGGEERVLARRARFPSVTADARRVVFNLRDERFTPWEVAWIDLERSDEMHRLSPAHRGARFPDVSPDGRFVAYISGETSRDEIYLTRLPSGEGKWQVSTSGGGWVRFSPQGDAVIYRTLGGAMMSVPIAVDDEVTIGRPQPLFDWGAGWLPFYDLSFDGRQGIAAVPVGGTGIVPSVSIVKHWQAEFAAR
jgi:eukaryotic-like serine/threonine-protein kinase